MTEKMQFRISSGLKNIIGKELITDDLIAIFELVKNSYDADASLVKIIFENIKEDSVGKGKITIIDNGLGMSKNDILNKWLFVGYSDKKFTEKELKNFRNKVQKNKIFAGAKGVGRFSCDKLGKKLNLYTKTSNEESTHILEINWGKFEEDQQKEFQTIKVEYKKNKDNVIKGRAGTILEITNLRDDWDHNKLLKLKRYLQRLISPSKSDETNNFKINLQANEYEIEDKQNIENKIINGDIKNIVFEKMEIKTIELKCDIEENGKRIKTTLTDKGDFIFKIEEDNVYNLLKNISVKIFYLNKEAKGSFTKIMGITPKDYGSIFLYKNGFRIHPYGNPDDDWLRINLRSLQGVRRNFGNRDLIGRIEINGIQSGFTEVSSRDGGVEKTKAYAQLQDFFRKNVLMILEKYVIDGLLWDNNEFNEDEINQGIMKSIEKIVGRSIDKNKEIKINTNLLEVYEKRKTETIPILLKNLEHIRKFIKSENDKKYVDNQIKTLRSSFAVLSKDTKITKKESLFLKKIKSTDKDILININHTIENSTRVIKNILKDINKIIKNNGTIKDLIPLIDELDIENEKVKTLSNIVSFANFNTKVEYIKKDIILYIKDYLNSVLGYSNRKIKVQYIGLDKIFVTSFKPLEISIMLDNFISNSKKANANKMIIKFESQNKKLFIYISDNGKGVNNESKKYIFKRGYTTTKGSGIGLHHIKQILDAMNGEIIFKGNNIKNLEKGACFEVILND